MNNPLRCGLLSALVLVMIGTMSHAAFVVVDDFEGLTPGTIGGQVAAGGGTWVANQTPAALLVGIDPDDASNQVLQVGNGTTTGNKTLWNLGIPAHSASDAATLFLRFRTAADVATNTADISFGLTIQNPPANNFNFQAQARVRGSSTLNPPQFDARDGAAFLADGGTNFALVAGSWYNAWVVQDHPTDQYSVYLQGPGTGGQTLMFAADDPLAYRVASGGAALEAFFLRSGGASGNLGPFYVDDIHVDATGENLANPVPEPTAAALASIGGFLACVFERRRRR